MKEDLSSRLHPGWGGAILGIGGASLASLFNPWQGSELDHQIGSILTAITAIVFGVVLCANVLRLFRHRQEVLNDLRNPMLGGLFGTIPAGSLVLGIAVTELGLLGDLDQDFARNIGLMLTFFGIPLALLVGFVFFTLIVERDEFAVASMTGAWFIPIVVLVLTPSLMLRIQRLNEPSSLDGGFVVAAGLWGAGFFLFIFLGSVIAWRLITTPRPSAHMAPSWFIWLAPASAGALGLNAILSWIHQVSDSPSSRAWNIDIVISGSIFLGFATWWLAFATLQVWRLRSEITFHVGSWGFAFPFAAYSALVTVMTRYIESSSLQTLAITTWTITLLLLLILIQSSIRHLVRLTRTEID